MKKVLSMFLLILLVGVIAGCSDDSSTSDNDTNNNNENTNTNTNNDENNADRSGEVLKVWSFTDELQDPITTFEERNGSTVELTIVPIADYPTKLKPALESGVGAPDVFTGEIAFLKEWTDRNYWENLSAEPYNVDEWSDDYVPYVWDLGKDSEGNVRAVSWQTTPGGIFYRRSIAEEVLGTDDPAEVGDMMSSWDKMYEVGDKLKAEGYRLFPDEGSIRWFSKSEDPQPWVNEDNELVMTEAKLDYFDHAKKLREKDYTAFAPEWSPSWFEGMDGPVAYNGGWDEVDSEAAKSDQTSVFSYALPTWGLHSVLKPNVEETNGDWAVTAGPAPYFWGGTWVGIYSGSENKDLAFELVEMMTHDEEFLTDWAKETGDVLSYLPVTEKIKDDFSEPFLDGQNNYEFFLEESKKIEPGIVTKYDQQIDTLLGSKVQDYVDGKVTKEEAMEEFYKDVKNAYPEIKTPE